jgi:hypothetical protein
VFRASIDTTSIVLAYFCFRVLRSSQDRSFLIFSILISRDDKLKESLTPLEDHPHFEAGELKFVGQVGR